MNSPPESYSAVDPAALRDYVERIAVCSGLRSDFASILADMLVENDLRGNFSHGSMQIATYAKLFREGTLNTDPAVQVVRESPVSVVVDGDGGLGYFPAQEATSRVIDKAASAGMAVGLTRNHGHFGSAGIYARMTVEHELLCFITSGHQLNLRPGDPLYNAGGGSPMAFSLPAGEEAAVVLDFGTMHDLYAGDGHRDEIQALAPGLVLRCIGLGEICQCWGGLLSGLHVDAAQRPWSYPGANQGSMIFVARIDLFGDSAAYRKRVDEYVRAVGRLSPLPGFDAAYAAGGREEALRSRYLEEGIPVGPDHLAALQGIAATVGAGDL